MSEVSSATNTTNSIMQALDVGTGINIKDLAQSLADAENKPNMDISKFIQKGAASAINIFSLK